MSTQYQDYLDTLTPYRHYPLHNVGLTIDTPTIDRVVGSSVNVGGDLTAGGDGDILTAEQAGAGGSRYGVDNVTYVGAVGTVEATHSIMFKVDSGGDILLSRMLLGHYGWHLYVYNGVICYRHASSPGTISTSTISAPFSIVAGETYHVSIVTGVSLSTKGHPNDDRTHMYINGDWIGSYSGENNRSALNIGSANSSGTMYFGNASRDATIGHYSAIAYALTAYQSSKLGWLAKFNANPVTVSGTIDESYLATDWFVNFYRFDNGSLIRRITTSTSNFSEVLPDLDYSITVNNDCGERWIPLANYALGQKVFPLNPTLNNFYFECTTAGQSGAAEPAWQMDAGDTTSDGTVVWTVVENLIQPVTHAPVRGA